MTIILGIVLFVVQVVLWAVAIGALVCLEMRIEECGMRNGDEEGDEVNER